MLHVKKLMHSEPPGEMGEMQATLTSLTQGLASPSSTLLTCHLCPRSPDAPGDVGGGTQEEPDLDPSGVTIHRQAHPTRPQPTEPDSG